MRRHACVVGLNTWGSDMSGWRALCWLVENVPQTRGTFFVGGYARVTCAAARGCDAGFVIYLESIERCSVDWSKL